MAKKSSSTIVDGKNVLITGGTGSFGQAFARHLLDEADPRKVIVFSRDELKQFEMAQKFRDKRVRFFIGDVRDGDRLRRAFQGVDIVVHAAALKQVPICEYNPFEAVKTNILGAQNIIDAAIDCNVEKVLALSTDKAVNPVNLYGATKLVHEKLFVDGNAYVGDERRTRFAVARYGNVVGSRGSVVPFFASKRLTGVLPVTDKRMTRFWITMDRAVAFVMANLERMRGGEIFVPRIPSLKIMDLARIMAPEARIEIIGIRPGEKLHEMLLHADEARRAVEFDDYFVVKPESTAFRSDGWERGRVVPEDFYYSSDNNTQWLTDKEMRSIVDAFLTDGIEPKGNGAA
jgi:UDP-N-acetylglucosamine 4,6-dehydratase